MCPLGHGHAERQGAEDGGRKSLAEEFHGFGRYFTLGPDHPVSAAGESPASEAKTIASATMRESSLLTRNTSERCRLLIDQRHLDQLHVDCETQAPVDLIKQCGFPPPKELCGMQGYISIATA
jgi:hypothetical protein